ncbi:MAG: hypothetical protein JOZ53_06020 [Planctomycetaceae bacterium]|nr:hypothetical protein [Planctomycetaceae bacterium]
MRRITYCSGLALALLGLMAGVAGPTQAAPTFDFTTFDVPGGTGTTEALGINNTGQIVGSYGSASGGHGFLKEGSTYTTLDVPGVFATTARGINGTGQIVGEYENGSGLHGFLKEGSTYTTFDVPGEPDTVAFGINGAGQIVGLYRNASGSHGFLATPVPEPASVVMGETSVLVGLGYWWRRRVRAVV